MKTLTKKKKSFCAPAEGFFHRTRNRKNNDSLHKSMRTTTYRLKHKISSNSLSTMSKLVELVFWGETTVLSLLELCCTSYSRRFHPQWQVLVKIFRYLLKCLGISCCHM